MPRILAAIASIFVSFGVAYGESLGVAYYALRSHSWPCDKSYDVLHHQPVLRISYLANTFGNSKKCLKRFLSDPRPKAIEVHLLNGSCVRYRRCGLYEALRGESETSLLAKVKSRNGILLKRIRHAAKREAQALAPYLGNIQALYVSPILEHRLGNSINVVIEEIRPYFPTALIVDNPLGKGYPAHNADLYESHGEFPLINGTTILNLDGADIKTIDVPAYLKRTKKAHINFLWTAEFNGRCKLWQDPRKRTCWPKSHDFNAVTRWMNPLTGEAANVVLFLYLLRSYL